ncbi:MAG: transcription elongation factor GreB, partial [Gammaproteobacteria bacterium]
RVRYLGKRLDELKVVDQIPSDTSRIYFGAWVELENDKGEVVRYRIVGPDEFDPEKGYISMDSPVAKALMKKTLDDEVIVETPKGRIVYYVVSIRYK